MSRIQLNDTGLSAAMKMGEGNPGALRVVAECMKDGEKIDPESAWGGLGAILALDTLGVYGPRIWMLYKDVCGQHLRVMLAVLRANQLGFISDTTLNRAIDSYGEGLDIPALVAQVEKRLPKFQRAVAEVS